jgi:D-glycero-alpha-D-manno-heptose-7-phosphate kinase
MIISRTPYRISFFGGGTDYPAWYGRHGGAVLATTIDKYCYLTCRNLPPFFEHRIRTVYSKIESCQTLDQIAHPAIREVLRFLNITRGVEIHHDGDLPARSGTGSSSAFTVGLLHALHALCGRRASKERLARESIYLEQNVLGETVGSQDQVMAACGGLNHLVFHSSGKITVSPALITPERKAWLNAHLMLFYTGIKRTASDVAASYVADIASRETQLETMQRLVQTGLAVLAGNGDIGEFGELLHEAWIAKSSLSECISNPMIDRIYDEALAAGATGGKLLGAGGGGFLLLFVRPERQSQVHRRLERLVHVPFKFEDAGSQIVFRDQPLARGAAEPVAYSMPAGVPEISLSAA